MLVRTGVELVLVVVALCASTWRATRLLVKDDLPIVKRPRDAIAARAGRGLEDGHLRWYGELVTCAWCVSVYVAAAFTIVTDLVVGIPVPVLVFGLAAAFAATYEHLTAREPCPQVDLHRLVVDALEDPGWQRYAASKLDSTTTLNFNLGRPHVTVHSSRGHQDVDAGCD